jgi:hypothetical protein
MSTTNVANGAGRIRNLEIQERVTFGEEIPRTPDLMGMRVVMYYITADNIVPCHLFVASRQVFALVFSNDNGAVYVINNDGRSQAFRFTHLGHNVDKFRLFRFKPLGVMRMQCDYFCNPEYNDTALVYFGKMGQQCTETAHVDQQVCARPLTRHCIPGISAFQGLCVVNDGC